MKSSLILKKYVVIPDYGTKNMKEEKTFFGSKMIDVEDDIIIDNSSIQYKQVYDSVDKSLDGYQYYDLDLLGISNETNFSINLSDLKLQYHTVSLFNQSQFSLATNTGWEFDIDVKNILRDYLFYKLKEKRTFKCVRSNQLTNKNINMSIYEYIDKNMLNRYTYNGMEFYVEFQDITDNSLSFNKTLLQLDPLFDVSVYTNANRIKNINVKMGDQFENLSNIIAVYNQTKASGRYKFNYYFNIFYKKI